jgi:hypothetical protein
MMEHGNKPKNKICKANGWLRELYLVGSVHRQQNYEKAWKMFGGECNDVWH